ncbi:MAG: carcinine hydrolase/isopenicillin-N N-acyltransferase family protein [Planctomycetota bacterium]
MVYRPKSGQAYLSATWPGYLGTVAGMNDRGVVVGLLDAPLKDESFDGVPAEFLARDALLRAKILSEAVAVFRDSRRARGGVAIIGDGKVPDARAIEWTAKEFAQFGPDDSAERVAPHMPLASALRRSNHFVDRDMATFQRTQYDPRAAEGLLGEESWRRFSRMTAVVQGTDGLVTVADTIKQLREVSDPAPAIEQFVMSPSDLEFWVSVAGTGGAEKRAYQRYALPALLAGKPAEKSLAIDTPEKPLNPETERLARGSVQPKPRVDESSIPEIYRLGTEPFSFESEPDKVVQGIARTKVRIPSPITTKYPENNTIFCEYFRPVGEGPFPCVIVLHIAGGDFELSRFMANAVAQGGVATIFVKMPFYGERRPPGSNVKMLAPDVGIASGAMQQTVQDLRRVCDWIEAYPELDGNKIGILGVSLGSITGSLTCAIEPRITHACFIMGGANLHDVIYESSEGEARDYRKLWSESGGTRESLAKVMAPFDAATYADRLRQRVVFMISASEDESIPKASSLALWEAAGRQRIIWYPCGHYTMVKYLMPALSHTVKFFRDWPDRQQNSNETATR